MIEDRESGEIMSDMRVASRMVDKRGRVFRTGEPLQGLPGVVVRGIERTGSYVTVRFERIPPPVRPRPPLLMHVDDVRLIDY